MPGAYEAIVIGARHNGLTCACYLARAGLKVLVLERYETYGGMTISEEIAAPGFLSDVHASGYLVAKLTSAPEELGLARHGLTLITPDPNWAQVFRRASLPSVATLRRRPAAWRFSRAPMPILGARYISAISPPSRKLSRASPPHRRPYRRSSPARTPSTDTASSSRAPGPGWMSRFNPLRCDTSLPLAACMARLPQTIRSAPILPGCLPPPCRT